MEISMLESDLLASHHPIPYAKFALITAVLNMSTYHKSANDSPTLYPFWCQFCTEMSDLIMPKTPFILSPDHMGTQNQSIS